MTGINPSDRICKVTTATGRPESGESAVFFSSLRGKEEMSQCFTYHLRLVSEDWGIDAAEFLGTSVQVLLERRPADQTNASKRYFNGDVEQFSYAGEEGRLAAYDLVLRPNFWFLSKTTDNRIFQNKSAVDIIKQIFDEYGFDNFEFKTTTGNEAREYCVQYGESDLDFVQRLMEHEGLFYFFEQSASGCKMIIIDANTSADSVDGEAVISYLPAAGDFLTAQRAVLDLQRTTSVVPGGFTHTDYDFMAPSHQLKTTMIENRLNPHGEYEKYEYPGSYVNTGIGEEKANIRNIADQVPEAEIAAVSNAPELYVGTVFELDGHPRASENMEYLILSARYELYEGQFHAGNETGQNEGFSVVYRLIPNATPYHPPRRTPCPIMRGPQTAVVVGPSGEEIYTDKYARVKVQFHWDREGKKDEEASCFVRVSSAWAGSGWGFIQIPRIGQEVIVDFLEGDPDRPIITGRVYNDEMQPPYPLPGDKTKSGWKSNSSLGGGGWNELMFEDKKGEELVYFQAEKNHDELVKNDETRKIGNDWFEEVDRDATQIVHRHRDETVDGNKKTHVKGNRTVNINKNDTETVDMNRTLTVHQNESITVDLNSTELIKVMHMQTVGVNQTITVGGARVDTVGVSETRKVGGPQDNTIGASRSMSVASEQSHKVGTNDDTKVGANQTLEVGKAQSVTVGADQIFKVGGNRDAKIAKNDSMTIGEDMTIEVGKNLVVKAVDSITFTCGKANIQMQKNGEISISGKDITTKGTGKITVNASSDVIIKGSKISQN